VTQMLQEERTTGSTRRKVLIVDDDEQTLRLIRHFLDGFQWQGHDLHLVSACSAQEGLERLDAHPDTAVIILDVAMEDDKAGLTFVNVVRDERCNSRVRIVICTGGRAGLGSEVEVMQKYDVNGYLPKQELTREKLQASLVGALRAHDAIERIEVLKEKLVVASRRAALGDLAAGVVHDLNNPLTIAILHQQRALQMLADGDTERMQSSLVKIGDACERIQRLGLHLLNFARTRKEELVELGVRTLVEGALQTCDRRLQAQGIALDVSALTDTHLIRVRHGEMERVVASLVSNACDAMEGLATRRILFGLKQDEQGGLVIIVRDTGMGIAPELHRSVFESFFTTKNATGGSGLGLSISRKVLRDHGGDLVLAKSSPGGGAEFHIVLPSDSQVSEN